MRRLLIVCLLVLAGGHAGANLIDFETLPDGSATADTQVISDQYAELGVVFSVVDRETEDFVGYPRIAKVGDPGTAFTGCTGDDTPLPGQSVGDAFLTDNASITEYAGDLLVTYLTPVSMASGVLLDVDCPSTCEQWTIIARGSGPDQVQIINAPTIGNNEDCDNPEQGYGNSVAFSWSFDVAPEEIHSILFRQTGASGLAGVAFDNFSPATVHTDLSVVKTAAAGPFHYGEHITYTATVSNSGPGPATDVLLRDYLPPGTEFVSASGSCVMVEGVLECDMGDISVDQSESIDITVALSEIVIVNTATVSANETDLFTLGNTDTCFTHVECFPAGVDSETEAVARPRIRQNRPNPFNPSTVIEFSTGKQALVSLRVYDAAGRLVSTLVDAPTEPGVHTVVWDGTNESGERVASGVYFYQLTVDGQDVAARKAIVLK
jgi:uncharacterized repeat protein (TIGR01451 family)